MKTKKYYEEKAKSYLDISKTAFVSSWTPFILLVTQYNVVGFKGSCFIFIVGLFISNHYDKRAIIMYKKAEEMEVKNANV